MIPVVATDHPQFWPKPIQFDRSLYVVIRHFGILGMESVTDIDATRGSIVTSIASGQIDRVVAVHEYNPIEGWSRDITFEIGEAVEAVRSAA